MNVDRHIDVSVASGMLGNGHIRGGHSAVAGDSPSVGAARRGRRSV